MTDDELLALIKHHWAFDDDSGEFYWEVPTSVRVKKGDLVGTLRSDGYISTQFYGKNYKVHRLVWLWHHGCLPKHTIDHINGVRHDNRINNLRDVTDAVNGANDCMHADNSSGCKGVAFDPKYAAKPWRVQISRQGVVVVRKHFANKEEAMLFAKESYTALDSRY